MRPKIRKSQSLAMIAMIAALYAVMTVFLPIPQYQAVQLRIADCLSVIPFFLPIEGVLGLSIGCMVANFFSPYGLLDVVIGTISTVLGTIGVGLIGHYTTKKFFERNLFFALLYTAFETGVVIAYLLSLYGVPYIAGFLTVSLGELISIVVIGYPIGLKLPSILPSYFGVKEDE